MSQETGDLKIDAFKFLLKQTLLDEETNLKKDDDIINFGLILVEMLTKKQISMENLTSDKMEKILEDI